MAPVNRRRFVQSLCLGAAAVAIAPLVALAPVAPAPLCRCGNPIGLPHIGHVTLTEDEMRRRYIEPAMRQLADKLDAEIVKHYAAGIA